MMVMLIVRLMFTSTGGLENLAPDHFANVTDMYTDSFFWWVVMVMTVI